LPNNPTNIEMVDYIEERSSLRSESENKESDSFQSINASPFSPLSNDIPSAIFTP
jgi:hypothetical protein